MAIIMFLFLDQEQGLFTPAVRLPPAPCLSLPTCTSPLARNRLIGWWEKFIVVELACAIMGAGKSEIPRAGRQAGADVAVLRQNFFSRKPHFLLLRPLN